MRNRSIYGGLFFFGLLSVPLIACGVGSDDRTQADDRDEAPTIIKPDGSDLPGKVKVLVPTGAPADTVVKYGRDYSQTGAVGAELGPLSAGDHAIGVSSSVGGDVKTVRINPNQVTTVKAGLVAFDVKNAPPTFGLSNIAGVRAPDIGIPLDRDGTQFAAMFAGEEYLQFGLFDGIRYTVAEDGRLVVKVWDYAERQVVKIIAPIREFPTAECARAEGKTMQEYYLYARGPSWDPPYDYQVFWPEDGKAIELGRMRGYESYKYTLSIKGRYDVMGVELPLGAYGAGPREYRIGRIDVDHVAVRQPDGTVKMTQGEYKIEPLVAEVGGVPCNGGNFATRTGLDLHPGRYRVTVSYWTVEAGTKTDVHVVDI